jgi:hypothetical protein
MTTPTRSPAPTTPLTRAEWHTLRVLRARYQQDRDLLSERERAYVRFLRWLYETGRLAP